MHKILSESTSIESRLKLRAHTQSMYQSIEAVRSI